MAHAFLIASCIGMVFVLNAIRPVPGMVLSVPSFFISWLTSELAPQLLVIHAIVATSLGLSGGFGGWEGHLALAFDIAIAAGLGYLIWVGQAARKVTEDALRETLGDDYLTKIRTPRHTDYDLRTPWRQLIMPFWMRHPDVERVHNLSYGPVKRRNLIDVYRNKAHPTGAPILIYVHGGAWVPVTHKDHQGKPLMLHLASRGWVCFAPNYRLSPPAVFPDHIIDVKKAIAWVREHAAEFGGDPSFIAIAGGSAGGHLSALAALTPNDPEYQPGFEEADAHVDACMPIYAVLDFTNEAAIPAVEGRRWSLLEPIVMKKKLSEAREDFVKASPLHRVNQDAPPFFVIHGKHDSLVPVAEARYFVERLRAVSRQPVAYAELPGTQHAFDVFPSIRSAHVVRAIERFLDYAWSARAQKKERPSRTALRD
ncbi:MAG TPA: alpha/beta hydrolase [Actinomycetota bacterium]|nr:alpha/beta hydrolase [Actinomycetota bacterium]